MSYQQLNLKFRGQSEALGRQGKAFGAFFLIRRRNSCLNADTVSKSLR